MNYAKKLSVHWVHQGFLRQGWSVDKAISEGKTSYQMVSLEHFIENREGLHLVEDALARRKRRGKRPNPAEDIATTRIMSSEQVFIWSYLSAHLLTCSPAIPPL